MQHTNNHHQNNPPNTTSGLFVFTKNTTEPRITKLHIIPTGQIVIPFFSFRLLKKETNLKKLLLSCFTTQVVCTNQTNTHTSVITWRSAVSFKRRLLGNYADYRKVDYVTTLPLMLPPLNRRSLFLLVFWDFHELLNKPLLVWSGFDGLVLASSWTVHSWHAATPSTYHTTVLQQPCTTTVIHIMAKCARVDPLLKCRRGLPV